MKTLVLCFAALVLCSSGLLAQYVSTPAESIPIRNFMPPLVPYYPGNPPTVFPVFDFAEINGDNLLDLVTGQNLISSTPQSMPENYYNYGDWRPNTGGTPTYSTLNNFFYGLNNYRPFTEISFGALRPGQKKDLAMGRADAVEIYRNASNSLTGPVQTLAQTSSAINVTWGPFNYQDVWEDLMISLGNKVRIYRNDNGNGFLQTTPDEFSFNASKVVFAQMNASVYAGTQSDKWDLVSFSGNVVTIRHNNNNNQFAVAQTLSVADFADGIRDIAVGDLNNDGYNDVVVTSIPEFIPARPILEVFLNNGAGLLSTAPVFVLQYRCCYTNAIVTIADFGSPGDGTRNDGWNDIVFAGYDATSAILINTRTTPNYFSQTPDQELPGIAIGFENIKQIRTADINNTGGQSIVLTTNGGGFYPIEWTDGSMAMFKHTGNPAPAPPKNLTVAGAIGQHPQLTWSANTERDMNQYNVYRKFDFESQYNLIATLGSTTTSYTDLYVTIGPQSKSRVYYYVNAVDAAQNASDPSNVVWKYYQPFKLADGRLLPSEYALHQAYPNPFNPSTQVNFDLPEDGFVTLNVFDILGRKVGEIVNANYAAGYHSATWNVPQSGIASGVYFARFTATDANGIVKLSAVNKLLLSK